MDGIGRKELGGGLAPPLRLWLLVWRRDNGGGLTNEVKLRRARFTLGVVTTSGGSTCPGIYPGQKGVSSFATDLTACV